MCIRDSKPSVRRQHLYRQLRESMPVLTAEAVYRQFRRERAGLYDCAALSRVFHVDDHALWPEESDDEQERQWQRAAEQTQTAMETVFSNQAAGGEAVREQLAVSARGTADYRCLLYTSAASSGRACRRSFPAGSDQTPSTPHSSKSIATAASRPSMIWRA